MKSDNNDDFIPIAVPVLPIPFPDTAAPSPTAPPASGGLPLRGMAQRQQSSFQIAIAHDDGPMNLSRHQKDGLKAQGYTAGLMHEILLFTRGFHLRYWIVDNSGSMMKDDGNRLVKTNRGSAPYKMVSCSRWKEIQEAVTYHLQIAALLEAPTTFCLLNNPGAHIGPQEFSIATTTSDMIQSELDVARRVMERGTPTGVTPLTKHVKKIRDEIEALKPILEQQGRRVAIIIATDGLPTNEHGIGGSAAKDEFVRALKTLEGLPVWIVIRLCTDEEKVVEFYNSIDSQLELSIEVLDDFVGEAEEVYEVNPWLNYTLPIHRMREMGIQHKLFDLLDERLFTLGELREFSAVLFGRREFDAIPDPDVDFADFLRVLNTLVGNEDNQYNPISRKKAPLINVKEVVRLYGKNGSCAIM